MILQAMGPTTASESEFFAPNPLEKASLFPGVKPHPKPSSKRIENASLATRFSHLWVGVHDPPSPGPNNLHLKPHCSHPTPRLGPGMHKQYSFCEKCKAVPFKLHFWSPAFKPHCSHIAATGSMIAFKPHCLHPACFTISPEFQKFKSVQNHCQNTSKTFR
jgi:hypothetical protein